MIDWSKVEHVEIDPDRCSGQPVIAGRRFTVAQIVAEIADGQSPGDVAANFSLDEAVISRILYDISMQLLK